MKNGISINNSFNEWYLINIDGKIIDNYDGYDTLNKAELNQIYPDSDSFRRYYNISDLKKVKDLKEGKYSFQAKIPLLKEIKVNPIIENKKINEQYLIQEQYLLERMQIRAGLKK
jgi:hypothetical protein